MDNIYWLIVLISIVLILLLCFSIFYNKLKSKQSFRASEWQAEKHALELKLQASNQAFETVEFQLEEKKEEVLSVTEQLESKFESLAFKIFENTSESLSKQNKNELYQLLSPLKEKIVHFESRVQDTYEKSAKERHVLSAHIKQLAELNNRMSVDADNLVKAIKGNAKVRGDWGETQLRIILEKCGLLPEVHFHMQSSYLDEIGHVKRPDCILNLPDNRCVVVDSKVSLVDYEKYIKEEDKEAKKKFLNKHIGSIRNHIKDLNSKNYTQLYDIDTPDYVMLFFPLEGALNVAGNEENLFKEALEKNIVFVTPTTLVGMMRTIAYLWKQNQQNHSAKEIAIQSGLMYDALVKFVEELQKVGISLDKAQESYDKALKKLVTSPKKGTTIIGRAKKVRELGANTNENLPERFS